jgi:23S rRNA pseudouridine2605 synthase
VYPVGRLDYLSEGLLLLTNDGLLAQKLTHASSHVPKTYLVKVSGKPAEQEIDKLRAGIKLPAERKPLKAPADETGKTGARRRSEAVHTAPSRIKLLRDAANPWYEVTLVEGRNRQIRRMFEEIGHHVEKIKRVRYGPLELDVEPGKFRHLTTKEVALLSGTVRVRK